MDRVDDTIVARSSPPGVGAVAVIRISGPATASVISRIARARAGNPLRRPRRMLLAWVLGADGQRLDEALVVYMPAPSSYTGEDMAEIHCHGGESTVSAVVDEAIRAGARGAMPGEFTRRALKNGKLDLSQAESVMRLIGASSREQLLGAARALGGELAVMMREVEDRLLGALARVEADIDFPTEPEVEGAAPSELKTLVGKILSLLDAVRRVPAADLEVVVAGRPNVGKSSLVNRLAEREVSIVTSEPGTTRDAVRTGMILHGARVDLVDTAGLGDAGGLGEAAREAERVARLKVLQAGLLVWVTDRPSERPGPGLGKAPILWVVNQADRIDATDLEKSRREVEELGGMLVSAKTGMGIDDLRRKLGRLLRDEYGPPDGIPLTSRQEEALQRVLRGAERAHRALGKRQPELAAIDLKDALEGVSMLTGRNVDVDILDRIFSEFCIGK